VHVDVAEFHVCPPAEHVVEFSRMYVDVDVELDVELVASEGTAKPTTIIRDIARIEIGSFLFIIGTVVRGLISMATPYGSRSWA
jgi:hypothetical protein